MKTVKRAIIFLACFDWNSSPRATRLNELQINSSAYAGAGHFVCRLQGSGSAAHQVFVYVRDPPEKTRQIRDRIALFSNKTENKLYSWLKTSLSAAFKWCGEHLVVRKLWGSGARGLSTYTRRPELVCRLVECGFHPG